MYLVILSSCLDLGVMILIERYERQMKKGVLEILVLKLLEREEKYGYQMISELRDKSEGLFALKEGTLYPILYRLEEEGFVMSEWSVAQGREASKKYYHITDLGKNVLKDTIQLWHVFSNKVDEILEVENDE